MPKQKKNKGKEFESDFKQSCQEQDLWIHRIKDNQLSYSTSFSTSKNPYDFLVFNWDTLFLVECKCTNLNSLTVARDKNDDKKMIKKHQIDSLYKDSRYDNVIGAFLIDFKTSKNTYLLPIESFMVWYDNTDKKSINEKDIQSLFHIVVPKELKRTRYRYNMKYAFTELKELYKHLYGVKR